LSYSRQWRGEVDVLTKIFFSFNVLGKLQTSNSGGPRPSPRPSQGARAKGSPPCSIDRTELKG